MESKAQRKANIKYKKEHLKQVGIYFQKEDYQRILEEAKSKGETVSGYIKTAIAQRREKDGLRK